MNHLKTHGIILRRTDYGESDRIITFLTEQGKMRAMAKGVRKQKSKMAGGIELFSVSELQYIKGKGDIDTLTSTRLVTHYGTIVRDLNRTNAGYDFLRTVMRGTEDSCEPGYYHLIVGALDALNDPEVDLDLVRAWFYMNLLELAGHQPQLDTDNNGEPLQADALYNFDFDGGGFRKTNGGFGAGSGLIKVLRLVTQYGPTTLSKVGGVKDYTKPAAQLLKQMSEYYIQATAG